MSSDPRTDVFNLIRASWLPARRRSGVVERIPPWGITDGIDEDPFVAFAWPRPDFDGAAHELLIGLLTSAAAPKDEDEWDTWWQTPPPPGTLQERFAKVAHAFDLDGPGPRFLQDLDPLEGAKQEPVAALLIDTPGTQTLRNNADLFVKRGSAPALSRASAAMALFTLNAFAPSGGAGHRTSLRGGGPCTTLLVAEHAKHGETLWGRFWPNVETLEQVASRAVATPIDVAPERIFPWLAPTRTSNLKQGGRPTTPADVHPLQVYWGMPRRIRLRFDPGSDRPCALSGLPDPFVVTGYRTRTHGTDYSEGFEHPLTPYYRQKAGQAKLPVHPRPGKVSYRLWSELVVGSADGLREPAAVVRHRAQRFQTVRRQRFAVFGYDMDNMKARAWLAAEMPVWTPRDSTGREWLEDFCQKATAGAVSVARLLTGSVKSALFARPSDAPGDYGHIAERFYRETENAFFAAVGKVARMFEDDGPDSEDPTLAEREHWLEPMATVALRLFDDYAPAVALQDRDMHRHVRARFMLTQALRGVGKGGKALFERDLDIVAPATRRKREEAA